MITIKLLGIIFGLLMAYSTFLNYKRSQFSGLQFYFWEAVWILMIVIVFFNDFFTGIIESFGFIRTMDFFTVGGLMLVTLISFYNYSFLNKIKKNLEDIVRKEALKGLNSQK